MEEKGNAAQLLKRQVCWVEPQSGCMVRRIMLHDGKEYKKGRKKLEGLGIEVHPTDLYAPQKNERAEQMNHLLKNGIWTVLIDTGAPAGFWMERLFGICDACNRVARPGKTKTPLDLLTGVNPSFGHLQIFGCKVWTRVSSKTGKILDSKTISGDLLRFFRIERFSACLAMSRM